MKWRPKSQGGTRPAFRGPRLKHAGRKPVTGRDEGVACYGQVSEALLGQALNAISESALVTDADQRIVYANAAFTAVTGYSAGEVVGRNCRFLQGPGTDALTIITLRKALARQETFRGEILNYRKDGTPFWNALTVSPLRDEDGVVTHFVSVQRDITAQKTLQTRLETVALSDPVTGLPNRTALDQYLSGMAQRYLGRSCRVAVGVIDLDDFKSINDSYGHEAGDLLLAEFASRMRRRMRETDFLARLGGDEFVIVIEELEPESAQEQIAGILESLHRIIDTEFALAPANRVRIKMSLGLALLIPAAESGEAVLRRADSVLFDLKRRKADRSRWWQLETKTPAVLSPTRSGGSALAARGHAGTRSGLTAEEVHARRERLFGGGLTMYYQPVLNLSDGSLYLLEALARLRLGDGTILPPGEFLPQLNQEDTDLLFRSSLDQTLGQLSIWSSRGPQLRASINLHPATLVRPQCPQWVASALDRHNISPHRLVLEVLENGIDDRHTHNHSFSELRALGVGMAQDDLGAGHSSLRRLTALAFDTVKIDHRVTAQLRSSPIPILTFLATMTTMSQNMGWRIIAEGLEDPEITEAVTMLGIPHGQGYHLARPMPAEDVPGWIAESRVRERPRGIGTHLGALAFHWRHERVGSPHPGSAESCPMTSFLAGQRQAGQAREWHQAQHADFPDREMQARKLLEWLIDAAAKEEATGPALTVRR